MKKSKFGLVGSLSQKGFVKFFLKGKRGLNFQQCTSFATLATFTTGRKDGGMVRNQFFGERGG